MFDDVSDGISACRIEIIDRRSGAHKGTNERIAPVVGRTCRALRLSPVGASATHGLQEVNLTALIACDYESAGGGDGDRRHATVKVKAGARTQAGVVPADESMILAAADEISAVRAPGKVAKPALQNTFWSLSDVEVGSFPLYLATMACVRSMTSLEH